MGEQLTSRIFEVHSLSKQAFFSARSFPAQLEVHLRRAAHLVP